MSKGKTNAGSPFAQLKELKDKLAQEEASAAQRQRATGQKPQKSAAAQRAADKARISAATSDDTLSFSRLMGGVEKLPETGKHRVPTRGPDPGRSFRSDKLEVFRSKEELEADEAREHLRALAMGGVRFEVSDDGSHVEGRRIDLNPTVLRRLRRGQFPIDGRIDLHGMALEEARAAMVAYLGKMRERGECMVLVVHGKGEHSPGGIGILRGEIAAWLSQGAAAEHTAAFATAQRADGGEGATYVLLVRR